MKCRVCTNPITAKNRSPIQGVCKFDFRYSSSAAFERLSERRYFGRILHDTPPSPSMEMYERHIAALHAKIEREYEAELTPEQVKLLAQVRLKRITSIRQALPFREASLIPPIASPEEEMVMVELSSEEREMLKELRRVRKWYGLDRRAW